MSYIQFLLALAKQLGPKLPEAWPYLVGIMQSLRKIYEIMTGTPLVAKSAKAFGAAGPGLGTTTTTEEDFGTGKGKGKKKKGGGSGFTASGAEVDELLKLAKASDIPPEAMQEVANSFGAMQK